MRKADDERGAAAVEFALVLPLLVLLLVGIAEFGRAYHIQATLSGAAREGVRVMALRNDPAAARSATRSAALPVALSDGQIAVTPTSCAATGLTSPGTATVTATQNITFIGGFFGANITLTGRGVMQCNG